MQASKGKEDTTPPLCPYCAHALLKRPARKTKCPACSKFIFVKYRPSDPVKRLVTEMQAAKIEQDWAEHYKTNANNRAAAEYGLPAGATATQILAAMMKLADDPRADMKQRTSAAYKASRELSGKLQKDWAEKSSRLALERLLQDGFQEVSLRGGSSPCPSCASIVGQRLQTAVAKSQRPIPNKDCVQWPKRAMCCAFWAAAIPGWTSK